MNISDSGVLLVGTIAATLLLTMLTAALLAVTFLIKRDSDRTRYDDEKHRAILSEARASYERQIAALNMQLTATSQRWSDANHLVVEAQAKQVPIINSPVRPNEFLRSMGISSDDAKVNERLIFVLTPFSKEEENSFSIIAKVCMDAGFTVVRGDEQFASGNILAQIVRYICQAKIVIANISTRNANVFYELGIAQALDKPTIIVSKTIADLPFDVKSQRIVLFKQDSDLEMPLRNALIKTLATNAIKESKNLSD